MKRDEVYRIVFAIEYQRLRKEVSHHLSAEEMVQAIAECARQADRLAEAAARAV